MTQDGINRLLEDACRDGDLEKVKLAIDYGAVAHQNWKSCDNRLLEECVARGHNEILNFLLLNGANIRDNKHQALVFAAKIGNLGAIELLIDNGADPKVWDYESLEVAGSVEVVRALLPKTDADINRLIEIGISRNSIVLKVVIEGGLDFAGLRGDCIDSLVNIGAWEALRELFSLLFVALQREDRGDDDLKLDPPSDVGSAWSGLTYRLYLLRQKS